MAEDAIPAARAAVPEAPADEPGTDGGRRERARRVDAERRERATEAAVALGFIVLSALVWAAYGGARADPWLLVWMAGLCALLVQVEFEVGEGITRPLQLVLAAMFALLPAGAIPAAVAAGHVVAAAPAVLAGRRRPQRMVMVVADSSFALGPAVVVGSIGLPRSAAGAVVLVGLATLAQFAVDFAVSWVRVRVGARYDGALLRPFAWVWLVDLLLLPVGLFVAFAAHAHPLLAAGVLPLAGLLAVFARERTGRIENALALQRLAQEGRDRLQSIVQNASDLIAIVRADGTVATVTGSVESVFGPGWRTVEGSALIAHVHPGDKARVGAFLAGVGTRAGHSQEAEWRLRFHDGSWRHVSAVATNLLDDPRVEGIVITARDVDARKAFEDQLRHRAFHDPLTALANRALFYDRIEHALAREARGEGHVAVVFLDLDDFKPVNDRYGHAAGDALLVDVAERLRACARTADTAARLGGDEFGLLLESVLGPNEPVRAAERALVALGEPFTVAGDVVTISVSIGIALSGGDDRGVEELLRRADLAMYAAKRSGKRRLELYEPALEGGGTDGGGGGGGAPGRTAWFHSTDEQREEIVSVLEREDALVPAFQPIVDLRTGRVAGYEALARFADAQQRPPSAWFAQAHRCGLGYELEARALAAALAVPGRPAGTYLTLNLSPSALGSAAVAAVLPDRLDGLVIEITENEVITEDPEIAAALADIRRRGARLAVDDTGSGYAGLTHVMRLAPDVIKLDRTMVAGVAGDHVKAALIESFVRYAREIDATVCAEGIEVLPDLARLADLDVAYGQGYGLGRPGPPWPGLAEAAVQTCRQSFSATLLGDPGGMGDAHDARLEQLTRRLAEAVEDRDLAVALEPIARELHADVVRLRGGPAGVFAFPSRYAEGGAAWPVPATVRQTLAGDDVVGDEVRAWLGAAGLRSRLEVPIAARGRILGVLEALAVDERAWSRFEIRRARILAASLASALVHLEAERSVPAAAPGLEPVGAPAD